MLDYLSLPQFTSRELRKWPEFTYPAFEAQSFTEDLGIIWHILVADAVILPAHPTPGDVVTGVEAAVLLVDGALESGHRGDATTGVIDLLPLAVRLLALEGVPSDDEAILDLLLLERVSTEDLTGRECPAQLIDAGALPLQAALDVGADEAGGGGRDHADELGDGFDHHVLLKVRSENGAQNPPLVTLMSYPPSHTTRN